MSLLYRTEENLPENPWMKEEKGIIHRGGGSSYAAQSKAQYISVFSFRPVMAAAIMAENLGCAAGFF